MATIAGLYRVRGPSTVYYAVFDPTTGRLWTERSEQSARSQAQDAGLDLAPERSISHEALMKLSGRETAIPSGPPERAAGSEKLAEPLKPQDALTALKSRSNFAPLLSESPLIIEHHETTGEIFSGEKAVASPLSDAEDLSAPSAGAALNRDVLSEKRPLKSFAKNRNPFADGKPKRRE